MKSLSFFFSRVLDFLPERNFESFREISSSGSHGEHQSSKDYDPTYRTFLLRFLVSSVYCFYRNLILYLAFCFPVAAAAPELDF